MLVDGTLIEERFGSTSNDLLYAILKKLIAIENCQCGGGNNDITRVPIYNTYDIPAGATLVYIEFPFYGSLPSNPITYNALVGTAFGDDDLANENPSTNNPVTVTLNLPIPTPTTIYYQSNLSAFISAEGVAYLGIRLP